MQTDVRRQNRAPKFELGVRKCWKFFTLFTVTVVLFDVIIFSRK